MLAGDETLQGLIPTVRRSVGRYDLSGNSHDGSAQTRIAFASLRRTLRPARVAIVFNGECDTWPYHARRGLHLANQVWGGAGFVLVSHHDGIVNPELLKAVRAYDPDFVVTIPQTLEAAVHFDQVHSDEAHRRAEYHQAPAYFHADRVARDTVASACTEYKRHSINQPSDQPAVPYFNGPSRDFPDEREIQQASRGPVVACPPQWGGLIGAAVAAHAGIVEAPNPAAIEPVLEDRELALVAAWLLGKGLPGLPVDMVYSGSVGLSINPHETELAHTRTMPGLGSITFGDPHPLPALIVLGDTADDFALALLWSRTYGNGLWLPSTFGTHRPDIPSGIKTGLATLTNRLQDNARILRYTSLSLPFSEVRAVHDRFAQLIEIPSGDADEFTGIVAPEKLPWSRTGTTQLALEEQFDDLLTVPVTIDETGTQVMATPPPPAHLADPRLARIDSFSWNVDYSWQSGAIVLGRGLPGEDLLAPITSSWQPAMARASLRGVSHRSRRYDFVDAGIQRINRIARPALQVLSLDAWVGAKARQADCSTKSSTAGVRANQLARMLGGRDAFLNLFTGPLLASFEAMLVDTAEGRSAFPQADGVQLGRREGVLSFAGFQRTTSLDINTLRSQVDKALHSGVLTRGLVLRCSSCEEVQFQRTEKLGQTWFCGRCDVPNELDQQHWHKPVSEPTWFYDLHPIARRLLLDNGKVPALLASHLRSTVTSGSYHDIPELEFHKNGSPAAEIDLIAYYDDQLVVAECKSNGRLNGNADDIRREVNKKCKIACILQADQITFSTTKPTWPAGNQNAILQSVRSYPWPSWMRPRVEFVANLGAAEAIIFKHEPMTGDDR